MNSHENRNDIVADQKDPHKGDLADVVSLAHELQSYVQAAAEKGESLNEVEESVLAMVLRMGKTAIDGFLAAQGDGDLGETVSTEEGQTLHRSQTPQRRRIRTIFGEHVFEAYVYSLGAKTKIAFRPIDARMSLPEGEFSYLLEEFSQYFCIEQAFGKASQALERVLGQRIGVDSLERISRRMAAPAEEFLDNLEAPPAEEEGELLVMTSDNKGVPMLRRESASRPVFDDSKGRGNKQMATVASVYSVDRYVRTPEQIVAALFRDPKPRPAEDRPRPCHKRMVARLRRLYAGEGSDEPVEASAMQEGLAWAAFEVYRRLRPAQPLIRVGDCETALWEVGRQCLEWEFGRTVVTVDIADIIHVTKYVWLAGKAFCKDRAELERWIRERLLRILQGQVTSVIRGLRQMATRRGLRGQARKDVDKACGYFENNAHRMKYDEYLRLGYPIASGVIEGACRHLVKDRMERSGMRWTATGAQSVLSVRALHASDLWDEFQDHRRTADATRLHPHRSLLADYTPFLRVPL